MHETAELQSAIAALWADARPRLLLRVEALEAAAGGPFGSDERDHALIEAHTLAGTLGAFGRAEGTEAARAAERALEAADREALAAAVARLRAVMA
jgi:HPt (histidine-containing phosphotransfer) domain-containing protein